jgi:hypothetical protein
LESFASQFSYLLANTNLIGVCLLAKVILNDANVAKVLNVLVDFGFERHVLCPNGKAFRVFGGIRNVNQKGHTGRVLAR